MERPTHAVFLDPDPRLVQQPDFSEPIVGAAEGKQRIEQRDDVSMVGYLGQSGGSGAKSALKFTSEYDLVTFITASLEDTAHGIDEFVQCDEPEALNQFALIVFGANSLDQYWPMLREVFGERPRPIVNEPARGTVALRVKPAEGISVPIFAMPDWRRVIVDHTFTLVTKTHTMESPGS